jgi:hypothetical protein
LGDKFAAARLYRHGFFQAYAGSSWFDRTEPGPETAVCGGELRALDRALEDADLMTQREDL